MISYVSGSYNKLLSAGSTNYTYDPNGNMIAKASGSNSWTYKYDYENRLKQVYLNGVTVLQAIYDGDGWRIQTIAGHTTIYNYLPGSWDQGYVKDLSSGLVTDVVFAAGLRIGEVKAAVDYYDHLDLIGSVRLVTKSANVESFQTKYQPYGTPYSASGTETFQFTGKQLDTATSLYYYGYRYYDSQAGRFLTSDVLPPNHENPQSINQYIYALDNPLANIDPNGGVVVPPPRSQLLGSFGDLLGAIQRALSDVFSRLSNGASAGLHAITDTFKAISRTVTDAFNAISHEVISEVNGISRSFSDAFSAVSHAVSNGASGPARPSPDAIREAVRSSGAGPTPVGRSGTPIGWTAGNPNSDVGPAVCEITKTVLTGPPGTSSLPGVGLLGLLGMETQTTTSPSLLGTALSVEISFALVSPALGPEAVVGVGIAIVITVGLQFALSGYFGDPCTGPLHF
jgi:RHS repeat-associated protein